MDIETVREWVQLFESEKRILFPYFKDRYALLLLRYWMGERPLPIQTIKQGPFGQLLRKPLLQPILARSGGGQLQAEAFDTLWPFTPEVYKITLGAWGNKQGWRWQQTSRPGTNLVVQLNFSNKHDAHLRRYLKDEDWNPFMYGGHPVSKRPNHNTLAWARLDIDLQRGEALIEEVQNDWLRIARSRFQRLEYAQDAPWLKEEIDRIQARRRFAAIKRYTESALTPHVKQWDEAILSAAIWFLVEWLGIRRIYMHTHASGNQLKRISADWAPPRSLYTRLPQRFCFQRREVTPDLLLDVKNRRLRKRLSQQRLEFFVLEL